MPLKLFPPRKGHPTFTIRGTYFGAKVSQSAGTNERKVAAQELARVKQEIERGRFQQLAKPDFLTAAISYMDAGGETRFIGPLKDHFLETPLDEITQRAIDQAANFLYPDASHATRNRQVYTPISAILKHAGLRDTFKRPKGARGKARMCWLTPDQTNALVASAWAIQPRFGALMMFLFATGCRLSEALELAPKNLDLPRATAFVGETKNGKPRTVYLPPALVATLANTELGDKRVFSLYKSGYLYTMLDDAAKAAGVEIPDRVAFHIARHTWATMMRRYGGADTRALLATGAWDSRDAASVYEHTDSTEEAKRANLLPLQVPGAENARTDTLPSQDIDIA